MKSLFKRTTVFAMIGALVFGCLPKAPTRTTRPTVPLGPWSEKHITSSATGQTYRYLHIPGPTADAPVMLLLPGGFFDARIWLYFDKMAERFNVYALDWPDDSPMYKGAVEDMGDVTVDFLSTIGVSDLHVTGISAGAYPAVDIAANRPQLKVRSVVLISSAMFAVSNKEVRTRKRNTKLALSLEPEKMRATAEWLAMRNEYNPGPGEVTQKDIYWVRPYTYYKQIFEMTRNQGDRPQATEKITVPVLVMHGTQDEILDYEVSKNNPSVFPHAKLITIEGGLHSMAFARGPQLVKMIFEHAVQENILPPGDEPL